MNNVAKYIKCHQQAIECLRGGGFPAKEMAELDVIENSLTEDEKKQVDNYKELISEMGK